METSRHYTKTVYNVSDRGGNIDGKLNYNINILPTLLNKHALELVPQRLRFLLFVDNARIMKLNTYLLTYVFAVLSWHRLSIIDAFKVKVRPFV